MTLAAGLMAACASSPSATPSASPSKIDPHAFTDQVTNPYFPLKPGSLYVYTGTKEGAPVRIEVRVTPDRKTILGVCTVVVHDSVFVNGALQEDTLDWYAQDVPGNVWYFGEDTRELDRSGTVVSTRGSWLAGVNGADPGIVMSAHPTVGAAFQQELAKGVAEDRIRIVRIDATLTTPAGVFRNAVETEDTNPLEPDTLEHKWFAPGVGFVGSDMLRGGSERIRLERIAQA